MTKPRLSLVRLACALSILAALSPVSYGQSEAGGGVIAGVVKDASGLPTPGASVTLRSKDTGYVRTATTRGDGRFQVIAMPVGRYVVEASVAGQASAKRDDILLTEIGRAHV